MLLAAQSVVARYKAAGFIPDKFWKRKQSELKQILATPLDEPYDVRWAVRDKLTPFFGLFKTELERYGVNRHAMSTVDMRVDTLVGDNGAFERIAAAWDVVEKEFNSTHYPPTEPSDEVSSHIAIKLKELFKEQVSTLGKALNVLWRMEPGSVQALAERMVKKATPDELKAIEAARNEDYSTPVLNAKYGFFKRVNLEGQAKKLIKKEKLERDYSKWFEFLKNVIETNYNDEEIARGFDEFAIGNLKAIILDPNVNLHEASLYPKQFIKARALLQQKGFGKVWYGVMFVVSREAKKLNEEALKAYRELGYDTLESQAGTYHSGDDVVRIYAPPDGHLVQYVVHEMGHRYWYKFMKPADRARFNALVKTNPSEKSRDFPSGPVDDEGHEKPVTPLSDYGKSTIEEAFAVAFEKYVLEEDMNRDQLESFRSVLAAQLLAQRFKQSRAIPIDKGHVRDLARELERHFGEKIRSLSGPLGSRVLGQWPTTITSVDGAPLEVYVRLETVPADPKASYVLGGGLGFLRGKPIVVVHVNGGIDAETYEKALRSDLFRTLLYPTLLHELTHAIDKYTPGVGKSEGELREDLGSYYNHPSELHAYMQEVVDQVGERFKYFAKLQKSFGAKAFQTLLNFSDTWKEVSPHWTERNRQKVMKAVYQALSDWQAQNKTAAKRVVDEALIEGLRKDFLTLMKNIPRVTDYKTGARLREAFIVYKNNFNELFFDQFLNAYKENGDERFEGLRKPAWDFYIELSLPLGYPDEYYSEEARFANYEREVKAWDARLRTKAQKFWKVAKEALSYQSSPVELEVADRDRLVMEGFQIEVVGYDPTSTSSWQTEAIPKLKEALQRYRRNAAKTVPWLLKHQLPLEANFNAKLGEGGRYHGRYISISLLNVVTGTPDNTVKTLAHEMGHHMFKHLSRPAQAFWNEAIRQDYGPLPLLDVLSAWPTSMRWTSDFVEMMATKDPVLALQVDVTSWGHGGRSEWHEREDFQAAYDRGEVTIPVPQSPITGYAGKNPEESFCEAIGLLVAYGPQAVLPIVRHWLEIAIPGDVKVASSKDINEWDAAHRVAIRYREQTSR